MRRLIYEYAMLWKNQASNVSVVINFTYQGWSEKTCHKRHSYSKAQEISFSDYLWSYFVYTARNETGTSRFDRFLWERYLQIDSRLMLP